MKKNYCGSDLGMINIDLICTGDMSCVVLWFEIILVQPFSGSSDLGQSATSTLLANSYWSQTKVTDIITSFNYINPFL